MGINKYILSFFLTTLLSVNLLSENLQAYFTYSTFSSPSEGPYIETYLSVIGNSLIYNKYGNNYQGVVEVTFIFKQGESIKKFKKYNLLSPTSTIKNGPKLNFVDQQRISLPNGIYDFDIIIKDTNSNSTPFQFTQKIDINYTNSKVIISDIELIESLNKTTTKSILSKSGYDIMPYTSDFYPESFTKIAFYAEIYNTDKILGDNEDFLINYSIESVEHAKTIGSFKGFVREISKPVNIILKSFPIEQLPSGNYNLVLEVKNKNNEILTSKKIFFQRSNPKVSPIILSDEFSNSFVSNLKLENLKEYIKSTEPISSKIELNFAQNQLKGNDEELMKQFFYNFWLTRNEDDPKSEWEKYYEKVKAAEEEFSTSIKKGYETDRGKVFLKYGTPNTRREVKSEPSSYPYEIWHYYSANNFSNVKFVFYSPDLITNEYPLLHTNMPGVLRNPQWKVELHRRTNSPVDINEQNNADHWGNRVDEFYDNPR